MDDARATTELATLVVQELLYGYRSNKQLADRALDQLEQHEWHVALDSESNPVAVIVRHVTGNLRSRWTDLLTADGEKPGRDRDGEFEESEQSVAEMRAAWDAAFDLVVGTLEALAPGDLTRTITIRGEPHTVLGATVRNLTHTAQHVGQIVQLAKHIRGEKWVTLSIPRRRR